MNAMNHHANIMQATYIWGSAMEKVMEGKESATEKVTLLKEKVVEFFCTTKSNITNHTVQASNTWDLVKEKAVEGKEAAAERVTSLKEAAV